MDVPDGPLARLGEFLHRRLVWLLLAVYALAGSAPPPGCGSAPPDPGRRTSSGSP